MRIILTRGLVISFPSMPFSVYILYSKKLNRYYTGYSSDLKVRVEFHQNAETRKFTAKADDWELFFKLICTSEHQALSIEKHIKKMKSSQYIQNLAQYPEMTQKLLSKYP
ncbi:GIY-YIG nuclease family protein [Owenweeksia hongkongensis]|uniref:GIY-YIG nuclease family protein n=1 Tax=Owenweeksia hongkongensis TaxID=253245 RepID=UPI003A94607F